MGSVCCAVVSLCRRTVVTLVHLQRKCSLVVANCTFGGVEPEVAGQTVARDATCTPEATREAECKEYLTRSDKRTYRSDVKVSLLLEDAVVYAERNAWSSLIVSIIAMVVYVIMLLQRAGGGPITGVNWVPMMLWTIGISIATAIVVSILWSILQGMRDPRGATITDDRDRDISRMADRVGQAFLVIAGLGVIVLCALGAELFWIAHTMFFGFAVSAIVGGIAQVIAYRRGLS